MSLFNVFRPKSDRLYVVSAPPVREDTVENLIEDAEETLAEVRDLVAEIAALRTAAVEKALNEAEAHEDRATRLLDRAADRRVTASNVEASLAALPTV